MEPSSEETGLKRSSVGFFFFFFLVFFVLFFFSLFFFFFFSLDCKDSGLQSNVKTALKWTFPCLSEDQLRTKAHQGPISTRGCAGISAERAIKLANII